MAGSWSSGNSAAKVEPMTWVIFPVAGIANILLVSVESVEPLLSVCGLFNEAEGLYRSRGSGQAGGRRLPPRRQGRQGRRQEDGRGVGGRPFDAAKGRQ